ncbi:cobW-domain-containing protein [Punctularia strigosozonata HHB-11173 SS5]|uniref:CobW-domain-containing protein n=1 Tax=Punctularia strigosozonata (strain HHB-11173) TaxID=741275 RepID=R7S4Z2_PUNST|nr:cobW-domain-containing protein [Punctularia strigosozonata HHB-11173 SS5]EIN04959.1 cobW-domain-containing protein [Punctularia strigosozonata HHB-11173 SS5]
MPIPITVFTGFLGAGKTSIITGIAKQLPPDYKLVLLKNEFGDVQVDSELAKQSSLLAVSEITNGCMCCVLVGQMKTALLEIREKYRPDRIIIECSGSAFPATLAFQIRELERETEGDLKLDAIVTVIDAENFVGYEDTSPTAKMQASYTDVILVNKSEHVSERQLDIVMDYLHTLNDLTPKIRTVGRSVDPNLIFGLDTKLFSETESQKTPFAMEATHNDEVETVTIYRGDASNLPGHAHQHDDHEKTLLDALSSVSKETVWRVKGFVLLESGRHILNWAFGRYDLILMKDDTTTTDREAGVIVKLTVMGERGEVKRASRKLAAALEADLV